MEHNCYNCQFRGNVPSSAHSSCHVLRLNGDNSNVRNLEFLLAMNQVSLIDKNTNKELVEVDDYGRKNGWASYPLDFDPIWIKKCSFYTEKKSPS